MSDIYKLLEEKILIMDGAMGSMIQGYKLSEEDFEGADFKNNPIPLKGNNDLLSITRPDIIKEIHMAYLEAGSDIIETNTFSATSISQADYEMQKAVYDINFQSAKIAKEAAAEYSTPDKPRFVGGAFGPTNRTASISPDVNRPGYRAASFDDFRNAYREQAEGLIDGGVDLLVVETIFDTLNAKACLFAIQEIFDERKISLPIMVSGTITDASGRTLSGQTAEAFLISVSHAPLMSVGFNCALGAETMKQYIEVLAKKAPFYVSAYPNAGLPNEFGQYDETPEFMGKQVEQFMSEGLVNILGGCCGTTPAHIAEFYRLSKNYKPRKLAKGLGSR
jgi:5-methyltetrahydrofolate--homocysteine methyltransferase